MFIFLSSGAFVKKDSMSDDAKTYALLNRSVGISRILLAASKKSFITKLFWDNRFSNCVKNDPTLL